MQSLSLQNNQHDLQQNYYSHYQFQSQNGKSEIDFITSLPQTSRNNNMILVVINQLSKRAHLIPTVEEITAQGIASLFPNNVFKHHGLAKVIASDRDPRFTSEFWKEPTSMIGIDLHLTSGYHPESNGQTERMNRTLNQYLRAFTNEQQTYWDTLLSFAEFSYNNTQPASNINRSYAISIRLRTRSHFTRKSLKTLNNTCSKRLCNSGGQLRDKLQKAKTYQTEYANKSRRDETFNIDDMVLAHKDGMSTMYTKKLGPVLLCGSIM